MKRVPYPLARSIGSQFERQAPDQCVCIGYGNDTLSFVLLPVSSAAEKQPTRFGFGKKTQEERAFTGPIAVGPQLEAIEIVFDDSAASRLPIGVRNLFPELLESPEKSKRVEARSLRTPDGYNIVLKPYSLFKTSATRIRPE